MERTKYQLRSAEEKATTSHLANSIIQDELNSLKHEVESKNLVIQNMEVKLEEEEALWQANMKELSSKMTNSDNQHLEEITEVKSQLAHLCLVKGQLEATVESLQKKIELFQDTDGGNDNLAIEVETLRLEKAELLTKISEEATSIEKRIRENITTSTSALEAQMIMEKVCDHEIISKGGCLLIFFSFVRNYDLLLREL